MIAYLCVFAGICCLAGILRDLIRKDEDDV